jgi:hypothetical protein
MSANPWLPLPHHALRPSVQVLSILYGKRTWLAGKRGQNGGWRLYTNLRNTPGQLARQPTAQSCRVPWAATRPSSLMMMQKLAFLSCRCHRVLSLWTILRVASRRTKNKIRQGQLDLPRAPSSKWASERATRTRMTKKPARLPMPLEWPKPPTISATRTAPA